MRINELSRGEAGKNRPKLQTKAMENSCSSVSELTDFNAPVLKISATKLNRATRNGAALIVAGAWLFAPDYSFAKDIAAELAAENAQLKEALEKIKKENEQLKNSLGNAGTAAPVNAATPAVNDVGSVGATASPVKEEEKVFTAEAPKALGEVVVNSRRKEEKLQDVPLPISVVGSEVTKRDNIVTVAEITQKVPNLLFTASNARQTSIAIRGLGKNASDEARDPSVGVQVDNVPILWPGSVFTNFVDLDHIELLRGPQGTLQGKNATLGLLNIITKAPSWTPQYYVEGFAGNRDALQGKVSASGPIFQNLLAYRGSFYIDRRDGYVTNLDGPVTVGKLKETDRLGGRIQFLFTPTETLSAKVILDRASANNTQIADYNVIDPERFTTGALRTTSWTTRLQRDHFNQNGQTYKPLSGNPREVAFDDIRPSRGDQQGVSAEVNWDVSSSHKLTSISAYRYGLFEPHNDGDRAPFAISEIAGGTVKARQWSEEVRLTSKEPGFGFIDYQIGALALRTNNDVLSQTVYGADAGAFYATNADYATLNTNGAGRDLMRASMDGLQLNSGSNPSVTSLSAFSQADLHLTQKATLTLGFRHTWEDRTNQAFKNYTTPHNNLAAYGATVGASAGQIAAANRIRGNGVSGGQLGNVYGVTERQGFDEHAENWLVNPNYKFTKNLMAYFSVSGGEKSGAVLFDANGLPENAKPERVLDFELGVKSAWFDKKLFVNLNLYDTVVSDYQARLTVADSTQTSGFRTKTGNVKEIEMQGVELETTWNAYEGLNLFFNGAFNYAKYTDFANAPCVPEDNDSRPCNFTGKTIPNAPLFTVNFGADYRKPLGVYGLDGLVFLNNSYRSRANMNADLSPYGYQEAYHITDGGIGVATHNGKYNLSLIARNIFDTKFVTNVGSLSTTSNVSGVQGEARYYGVNFRANF